MPDEDDTWQRYRHWYAAMLEQPAFRKNAFDQQDCEKRLVEQYHAYSEGGVSIHVAGTN